MTDYLLMQPQWLWLIPLVLLSAWFIRQGWLIKTNRQIPSTAVRHPLANDYQNQALDTKTTHHQLLYITCACLMLFALTQPVQLGTRLSVPPKPVDLMLIIDTSVSMVLQDYQLDGRQVDRMTMTQALLDRFTRRFSGKRIGIVVLGDQPHILLQPSEDRRLVRHLIHRLKPTVAGRQAALGDAVAVAAEHIKSDNTASETVMILISDAVLPSGKLSPLAGAERAVEAGAVLHTIAIGSSAMQGSEHASLIYEPADVKLLQQMASITGGKSFHAVDVAAMDTALQAIERQQQIPSGSRLAPRLQQPLYIWPLGTAILILIVMALLPYRSSRSSVA